MARPWSDFTGVRRFTDKDLDEIATNSTDPEAAPECLLAERLLPFKIDRKTKEGSQKREYLVKYAEFDVNESTWEPAKVFDGPGYFLVEDWERRKAEIDAGEAQPFDVQQFEEARKPVRDARKLRHDKRAEKRRIREWLQSTPAVEASAIDTPPESVGEPVTAADKPTQDSLTSLFESDIKTEPMDIDEIQQLPKDQNPPRRLGVFLPNADPLSDAALSNVIALSSDEEGDEPADGTESSLDSDESDEMPLSRRRRVPPASDASNIPTPNPRPAGDAAPAAKCNPKRPLTISTKSAHADQAPKRIASAHKATFSPRTTEGSSSTTAAARVDPAGSELESGEVTPTSQDVDNDQEGSSLKLPPIALPVDPDQPVKPPKTDIFTRWQDQKALRKSWLNRNDGQGGQIPYSTSQQSTWLKYSQAKHAYIPPAPTDTLGTRTSSAATRAAVAQTSASPNANDQSLFVGNSPEPKQGDNYGSGAPRKLSILSPQTVRRTSEHSGGKVVPPAEHANSTQPNTSSTLISPHSLLSCTAPEQVTDSQPLGGELLTCWFWSNKRECSGDCVLEHRHGFKTAPEGNDLERTQACCVHEFERGCCRRSQADCWASHAPRPYYAKLHVTARPTLSRFYSQYERGTAIQRAQSGRPSQLLPNEALGCFFWNFDHCRYSDHDCNYLHKKTRFVAQPKGAMVYQADGLAYDSFTGKLLLEPPTQMKYEDVLSEDIVMANEETADVRTSPGSSSERSKNVSLDLCKIQVSLSVQQRSGKIVSCEDCTLLFDESRSFDKISNLVRTSKVEMHCQTTCMIADVKQWSSSCATENRLQGVIKRVPPSLQGVQATLRAYDLVAIFKFRTYTMFLNALPMSSDGHSSEQYTLEFCICLDHLDLPIGAPVNDGPDLSRMVRALELEHESQRARAVYIAVSRQDPLVAVELTTLLQLHNVKVYDNLTTGSWVYFKDHYPDGIVLFDSEFGAWSKVPDLSKLLASSAKIFRLSPGNNIEERPARLFSRGVAICLLEDCLVDYAEETLPALRQLQVRATKSPTHLILAGRPRFLPWLADLITQRKGKGEACAALEEAQKILFEIQKLSAAKEPNLTNDPAFDPRAQFVTPALDDLPNYEQLFESDERQANTNLVDWFSGWSQRRVGFVRRFVVLSMCKREWRDDWHERHGHIACLKPMEFLRLENHYAAMKQQLVRKETAASPAGSG